MIVGASRSQQTPKLVDIIFPVIFPQKVTHGRFRCCAWPGLTPRRWKRHLAVSLWDHGVFKGAIRCAGEFEQRRRCFPLRPLVLLVGGRFATRCKAISRRGRAKDGDRCRISEVVHSETNRVEVRTIECE